MRTRMGLTVAIVSTGLVIAAAAQAPANALTDSEASVPAKLTAGEVEFVPTKEPWQTMK